MVNITHQSKQYANQWLRRYRRRDSSSFREIVAVMSVFNESDIITYSMNHLISQGIGVYLIDNWSDDGSIKQAQAFWGRGLIGIEKFPVSQPSGFFSLKKLVGRTEEL